MMLHFTEAFSSQNTPHVYVQATRETTDHWFVFFGGASHFVEAGSLHKLSSYSVPKVKMRTGIEPKT